MRNYELTLICSPDLAEKELNDTVQGIVSSILDKGGILNEQRILDKKPLLAPIHRNKEGYLVIVSFSIQQEKLIELTKIIEMAPRVLRFILLTKRQRKAPKLRMYPSELSGEPKNQQETTTQQKEEKIDIQEIDKKLEEILKEV